MTSPAGTETPSQRSELATRWLVAAVGVPLVVLAIYVGGWPLAGLLAVVAAVGTWEVYGLARATGTRPFPVVGVGAGAFLVLAAAFAGEYGGLARLGWAALVALSVALFAAAVWARGPGGRPLAAVSVTVAGAAFVGGTVAFAVLLRELPLALGAGAGGTRFDGGALTGTLLLAFPVAVCWLGDTAAYFGGRRWGRRKLIPSVSPGKTVEGAVTGLAASVLTAALFVPLALSETPFAVSTPAALLMGLLLGGAGQVGDLTVSALKREAGVKDSGRLLPGHGGVLDRLDSLFPALPTAYVLLVAAERGVLG